MEHLRFKSEQTAASYVANQLEADAREDFELHMLSCPECVEEVESWRAIKSCLPGAANTASALGEAASTAVRAATVPPKGATATVAELRVPAGLRAPAEPVTLAPTCTTAAPRWRLAAAMAAGVLVGVGGGWYGHSLTEPSLDASSIAFYSLPPLTRGPSDCTLVQVDPRLTLVALRIPEAAKEQQLVAVDSDGHDLAPEDYSVRTQADGSWLVRLRAQTVREQGIRFEARSADGTVEPRGCVLSGSQS